MYVDTKDLASSLRLVADTLEKVEDDKLKDTEITNLKYCIKNLLKIIVSMKMYVDAKILQDTQKMITMFDMHKKAFDANNLEQSSCIKELFSELTNDSWENFND